MTPQERLPRRVIVAARIAGRELRGGLQGFRIFLSCVILGVATIAAIGTLRESIREGIAREGARLLGGDAEITLTYRFATAAERAWMEGVALAVSEIVDFRSMAVAETGARALTQVKAVDEAYPLIGTLTLEPEMPLSQALAGAAGLPGVVMHPDLVARLGITTGEAVRLGGVPLRLMAVLRSEPDNATAGIALGPRSIVARRALAGSGLLAPGTLFSTRYRLDLPPGADLGAVQQAAQAALAQSGMRWRDARNGAPEVAAFVDRLGAFLVLVGLSGLAVGGVGISAALRAYLVSKTQVIATLRTLGAEQNTIFLVYFLQVGALALLGIGLGLLLGVGAPLALAPLIDARMPVPAAFGIYPAPMFEATLYSALTVMIFTLWPLARARRLPPAALYREELAEADTLPGRRHVLLTGGLAALLVGAAGWLSGSPWLTAWTAAGILAALVMLALAGRSIRALARAAARGGFARGRPALGWALSAISAPGSSAGAVVVSLGLGLAVLATVGQVDRNLRDAIARDLPERAPAFFFIDILKDQLTAFEARLRATGAVNRIDTAPMLRGVITRINGRPAAEVAGDHWVLHGDRGVTYADTPPERSPIIAGRWWPPEYHGPPQISFAAEEAAEMGLRLGDRITVNIMGRDITAELTSLRDVKFSTAGIGFVMVMNPAALAGAPHSFIATVHAPPEAEAEILRSISEAFPNITAIGVREAIEQVSGLLAGLASAIAWGAAATLLTGFLVLIGTTAADSRARRYEAAILKVLGATRARILAGLALRAAMLGAAAGLVALLAGIAGGWAACRYLLGTDFSIAWGSGLSIVAGGAGLSLLAGLAFALGPLSARPARILRARE